MKLPAHQQHHQSAVERVHAERDKTSTGTCVGAQKPQRLDNARRVCLFNSHTMGLDEVFCTSGMLFVSSLTGAARGKQVALAVLPAFSP